MDLTHRFLSGIPPSLQATVLLFVLGTITLLFSMIVASRFAGGIDFGPISQVLAKGAGLLAVVTSLHFFDFGILVAGLVWFFGLMFLFHLSFRETGLLTRINWGMNLVWKLLVVVLML
jgi:hypothetical protein